MGVEGILEEGFVTTSVDKVFTQTHSIVNNNISSSQISVSNNDLQKANKVYSKIFTVINSTKYLIETSEQCCSEEHLTHNWRT